MAFEDLRAYLERLDREGELARVTNEVDWNLELGAISRRSMDLRGPALLFENLISVGAHVDSGKLRALAVGAKKRIASKPELPTVAEAGVPGYEMAAWFGVLAPAGTPQPVIAALHKVMAGTLQQPEVRDRFARLGAEPVGNSPEEFGAFIQSEIAKWAKVVKEAGLKAD